MRGIAVFLAATVGDGNCGSGIVGGSDLAGDDADVLAGAIVDTTTLSLILKVISSAARHTLDVSAYLLGVLPKLAARALNPPTTSVDVAKSSRVKNCNRTNGG